MAKALRSVPLIVALAALVAVGCSSDTGGSSSTSSAAASVCEQIVDLGVGDDCREAEPTGLGAEAAARYEFDLPSVLGNAGQVLVFSDRSAYGKSVAAYDAASALAGPHRYGSSKALVFVQINEGLSAAEGPKVADLVAGL